MEWGHNLNMNPLRNQSKPRYSKRVVNPEPVISTIQRFALFLPLKITDRKEYDQ